MADLNQALPNNYPDLGTMFQYMPTMAAANAGQQSGFANQNNQSLQDAFAAQEAYNAQRRPFELQQLQAQTGLTQAQGRNVGAEASLREGTLPTDIKAGISKNTTAIGANDIEQIGQMGDRLRAAGAAAATETDPYKRVLAAKKVLGEHFHDSPELEQHLMSADPAQLPQLLTDMGTNLYNSSRAAMIEKQKTEAHQKAVETQTEAQKQVANIQGQSREQVAATQATARVQAAIEAKLNSAKDQAAALIRQASQMPDGPQKEAVLAQAQRSAELAAHMAEIAAQARNETGIAASTLIPGTTPPRAPMPSVVPPQGTAQPSAAAASVAQPQTAPLVQGYPSPKTEHLDLLQKNPDKKHRDFFDQVYGKGAAEAFLGTK
jgi:hypothetical protein